MLILALVMYGWAGFTVWILMARANQLNCSDRPWLEAIPAGIGWPTMLPGILCWFLAEEIRARRNSSRQA